MMFSPLASFRRSVGVAALGLSAACSLLLGAEAAAVVDLASVQAASGQWDMSLGDTNRKCRLTLRSDTDAKGYALAMPAGCRRAMPILADVGTWALPSQDRVTFVDRTGATVLEFTSVNEQTLSAKGPEGETYELVSTRVRVAQASGLALPGFQVARPEAAPKPAPIPAPQMAQAKPQPAHVAVASSVAAPPKSGDVAGRYAILRDGTKDTGCMLTLDDKARGPKGNKAQLAPACRDQGIVIFDPLGWRFEKGKLVLTARKGHDAHFEFHSDGTWQKDSKAAGKPLGFKKI